MEQKKLEPRRYYCSFCKDENAPHRVIISFAITGGGGEVKWRLCEADYQKVRNELLYLVYGKTT